MTLEELLAIPKEEPPKLPPKKYKLIAYADRCMKSVVDGRETDDWRQVEEFVWTNTRLGYTCELINTETGNHKYSYPDSFYEDTVSADELLADLLMEQKEQM